MEICSLHRIGVVAACLLATAPGAAQVPAAPPQSGQPAGQAPLRPLAVTQLDERQAGNDLDSVRPISLTLSDPTPITDLLLVLVRDTRLSVVPDPDVEGTFRGDLKEVTLRQALEMILQPHGLDYSVQGNLIRVFKRRVETRIYDLNYVITRRSGSRSLAASSSVSFPASLAGPAGSNTAGVADHDGAGMNGGGSAQVTGSDAGDIFADLSAGIQTLLSPDGRFNLDRKAALLQASDYPDRLDKVALYLDAVQNRATRQVSIQAKVIEVVLNDEFAAGLDWNRIVHQAGNSVSSTQKVVPTEAAGTFTAGLSIKDFPGLLNALATQGKVNVLASPRVNALNNEPAIMRVGTQDVFFKTTSLVDPTTGRILQTTVEPQAITEGVVLIVTPQIAGDGMINLSISPSLTERTGQAVSRLGDKVPILSVLAADTLVRVHENETIVIAGLMNEPALKGQARAPGIRGLFRRDSHHKGKTDLLILLTPTIMTPARVLQSAAQEQNRVLEKP